MMATGRGGRSLMGPLLAVNFVVYLIILGLAGWSLDKSRWESINKLYADICLDSWGHRCLLCGAGFLHYKAWTSDSLAAAASSAIISWAITALAIGLVCKEIILGGYRGKRLQTLEALIIVSTVSQLLYLVLLHAGLWSRRYGPGYRSSYGT
ncbi:hypothetical protein CK203_023578 [Vitis vinifera]|uniref:Uncharacterized protein n=1 Tax=Vitis vinifera TaxID=29760 RepID=A0A438JBN0_VITVI|nr:hypothetical protein CK203_023578 [Vitis vinifera]